jgi:hypothetical protein
MKPSNVPEAMMNTRRRQHSNPGIAREDRLAASSVRTQKITQIKLQKGLPLNNCVE